MTGCCAEPSCTRKTPIGIYRGDFGGQVYAATSARERAPGRWVALERHVITAQMEAFIRANRAWVREVLEAAL